MPSPDDCNNAATGTSLESGERLLTISGISICEAKNPDFRLGSDQSDGSVEACTAQDTAELQPIPTEDAYASDYSSDSNRKPTVSTETLAFGVNGGAGNAPESEARQELLQPADGSVSHSEAADQNVTSGLTDSSDEGQQSDFDSTDLIRCEPGALDEDEKDRYQVEEIRDHDVFKGWKRYLVKWSGWSEEDMTWEPADNLDDCKEVLQEYWASYRAAPRYEALKRKRYQDGQGSSDEDEDRENLEAYSDAGVRSKVSRAEGGRQRTTSKPHGKRYRTRKVTGRNARRCPDDAFGPGG